MDGGFRMPDIPVTCMVCMASIKDSAFPQHMQSIHGGMTQAEAIQVEKNIPKQQLPVVLDKDTPPSDEFMEIAKMLDKPKEVPPVSVTASKAPVRTENVRQEEPKPLELKYQWIGNCPTCNTPVKTITLKAKGQTVCVAYCLTHQELQQREVADLEEKTAKHKIPDDPIFDKVIKVRDTLLKDKPKTQIKPIKIRKEGKRKYVKRRKPIMVDQTTIQGSVSAS